MTEKRAKHCLCMLPDPQNAYNKIILAIGGVTVSYWRDPYQKQTKQKIKDLASVEFYSINESKWQRYNARLQIARHEASASYLGDFIYVIGGHTMQSPKKFINTIERCHKNVPSSLFERINIKQRDVDLSVQGLLSVPISEDRGILIITASGDAEPYNEAYFVDLHSFELKQSKFRFSIGPITDWKCSY